MGWEVNEALCQGLTPSSALQIQILCGKVEMQGSKAT